MRLHVCNVVMQHALTLCKKKGENSLVLSSEVERLGCCPLSIWFRSPCRGNPWTLGQRAGAAGRLKTSESDVRCLPELPLARRGTKLAEVCGIHVQVVPQPSVYNSYKVPKSFSAISTTMGARAQQALFNSNTVTVHVLK